MIMKCPLPSLFSTGEREVEAFSSFVVPDPGMGVSPKYN